ncbi:MAG: caspase family protein [Ignavibacteria bacterium]|nr:caspase family protein [Ignavibacteria bacterium]
MHASFSEPSGNGTLDAGEKASIDISIQNNGTLPATGIVIKCVPKTGMRGFVMDSLVSVGDIPTSSSRRASITISQEFPPGYHECAMTVSVNNGFGNILAVEEVDFGALGRVPKDNIPPVIVILSPRLESVSRGLRNTQKVAHVVTAATSLQIQGRVQDSGGITMVLINGRDAHPVAKGDGVEFQWKEQLRLGMNDIRIQAVDKSNNKTDTTIIVQKSDSSFIKGTYHALIIAEEEYTNPRYQKLKRPAQDARNLADVLIDMYHFDEPNVRLMFNPKRRDIYSAFDTLEYKLTEDDNILIFYAGHGLFEEKTGQGYWIPCDADENKSTWISNGAIRDALKAIMAKHVLLISDACFGGSIFNDMRGTTLNLEALVQRRYAKRSRKAITSTGYEETSDVSVFMEVLLAALKNNTEEYLDMWKLFVSVTEEIETRTHKEPQYRSIKDLPDDGGDFVFWRK